MDLLHSTPFQYLLFCTVFSILLHTRAASVLVLPVLPKSPAKSHFGRIFWQDWKSLAGHLAGFLDFISIYDVMLCVEMYLHIRKKYIVCTSSPIYVIFFKIFYQFSYCTKNRVRSLKQFLLRDFIFIT